MLRTLSRCLVVIGAVATIATSPAQAATGIVRVGAARFEVLTPSLIRIEYAADGRFENRPTMLGFDRAVHPPPYTARDSGGTLTLRTARITLSYRIGSGPFSAANLKLLVAVGRHTAAAATTQWESGSYSPDGKGVGPLGYFGEQDTPDTGSPPTTGNLGGWTRSLDQQSRPIKLHDGLISRDGWFFIDDTRNVVLTDGGAGFVPRPAHAGDYQDGYLFGYGHDYPAALADYRILSGPAPLLPRKAFGVWYSRYFAYTEQDYHALLARFRSERVPLDVLMVDTNYKSPNLWDGWEWNPQLFPDPTRFTSWAHTQGLDLGFNVHPSIALSDPRFAEANKLAGGLEPFALGPLVEVGLAGDATALADVYYAFDWANQRQLAAYFWLHQPFEQDGVDFWWLDWCCEESRVDGEIPNGTISGDAWINSQYARHNAARGSRWLSLARIGGSFEDWAANEPGPWGEQRSTIHFTGDAQSTWAMLDFETRFDAAEGNVGMPYVSNDIGGFLGNHLDPQLYVRWIQSGTFAPILRPHSNHGDRLPWNYPGAPEAIASAFLRLRESLIPYTYTVARQSHDTGMPITRAMYLRWPNQADAYHYDHEYMFGPELLVAPVGTPGDPATKTVWLPRGTWVDLFTGKRYRGPSVRALKVPLGRMPVFARAGAIIPRAPYMDYSSQRPLSPLELDVYGGANGSFSLYEDAGQGFGYQHGQFTRTLITWNQRRLRLTVGPARGRFPGQRRRRAYTVRLIRAGRRALTIHLRAAPTNRRRQITL
jgi:alpha-glucosidase (family GH31 glycosyl hydrolase)